MSPDLSGIIQSTGASLERTALEKFGAAVNSSVGGSLRDIFHLPATTSQDALSAIPGQNSVWATTHYASALTKPDQIEFNPKLKFLFKVSFEFDPQMISAARSMGYDLSEIQQNFSFLIRHIDRPKFDFDYEEVNMYNFRTKVLKSVRHREVGFTVYDDVGNNALSFVNLYRKLIQPIARREQDPYAHHEDHGFAFDGSYAGLDTSMRGLLPGDRRNVLSKMTIHQIFVERGSKVSSPASWVKVVNFVFTNPRFVNIDTDDLDHDNGGSFNAITILSDFDTMFMSEPVVFSQDTAPSLATGDIAAATLSSAPSGTGPAVSAMGASRNPFIDIIANQGARLAQQSVSNYVGKSLKNVPGGNLVAGQLTGVSGILGEAAKRTLGSIGSGKPQAIARPSAPIITDSNTTPSVAQSLSRQEASAPKYDDGLGDDFI